MMIVVMRPDWRPAPTRGRRIRPIRDGRCLWRSRRREIARRNLRGNPAYDGDVELWTGILWALAPTVVVAVLFFFVLRGILRMDRSERRAYARIEAAERAKRGMPPS